MSHKINAPKLVIADGDEGVQINEGIRLAFAGAGYEVPGFSEIVKALKKIFKEKIRLASTQNSAWMKKHLSTDEWEQVNALVQQHHQALADKEGLLYAGYLPFADPKEVKYKIKGHMVRPMGMHLANKICFTLGGGEKKFNLGQYLISADWVSEVPLEIAEKTLKAQVDFYQDLAGQKLNLIFQTGGKLGKEKAAENKKVLEKIGFDLEE
ncbi:MAG: hypothetical protein U9O78_02985 [Patescibacteria group bacterium]|nr:hypothetical protein [Patescibacteria group bacterium]